MKTLKQVTNISKLYVRSFRKFFRFLKEWQFLFQPTCGYTESFTFLLRKPSSFGPDQKNSFCCTGHQKNMFITRYCGKKSAYLRGTLLIKNIFLFFS
jgi:hypothetical protein